MSTSPLGLLKALPFLLLLLVLPVTAQTTANSALDAVEWVLQYPLTLSQRQILSSLDGWQSWAAHAQQLDQLSPALQAGQRSQWRAQLLSGTDPFDQKLKKIDEWAQKKLIDDLTMQAVDAFSEWILFATAVADGQPPAQAPPGTNFLAGVQQILRHGWPKLDSMSRQKLRNFPAYWASVRRDWPNLSDTQRQEWVSNWRKALAPLLLPQERRKLAWACLQDLRTTYQSQPTPQQLQLALARVQTAARRMAADPDPDSRRLSKQLQEAVLSIQAQQDQSRAVEQINRQSARFEPSSNLPVSANYNQVFRDINQQAAGGFRLHW